jgi:hypothetical protein
MDPTVLDTTPEALDVQQAIWRRMAPGRRLELALQLSDEVREVSIAGTMSRNPGMDRRAAVLDVTRRVLGDALFDAAFGGDVQRR